MGKPWTWLFAAVLWLLLAITVMFFATRPTPVRAEPVGSIHSSLVRPETEDWFSAYPASHRLIHGQDPVEPEGNAEHESDRPECDGSPKEHQGKMLKCVCAKWHTCAEDPTKERKSCSNFCWRQKCRCKMEDCD